MYECRQGLFGLGIPELAVIAGVAALIFGPSKLPELGKAAGETAKSFQNAAKEFNKELKKGQDVSALAASGPQSVSFSCKAACALCTRMPKCLRISHGASTLQPVLLQAVIGYAWLSAR
jgi:TatA/E family protein of Tat protein translocase